MYITIYILTLYITLLFGEWGRERLSIISGITLLQRLSSLFISLYIALSNEDIDSPNRHSLGTS